MRLKSDIVQLLRLYVRDNKVVLFTHMMELADIIGLKN